MWKIKCILGLTLVLANLASSWDIAITHGDQIEFYNNSTKTSNEGVRFRELTALAYDAVHNLLIFVDKQNDNASIFSYHLATKKYQPLVKRKIYENIQGIAFDPIEGILFWTDTNERSIFRMSVSASSQNNAYGNLLLKMDDELPRAIAVDSCRGYIYWTNTNVTKPTIERARFDGSERKTIVDQNIYMPVSIAIDQHSKRLYWADDKEGIHYSIEHTDLEGKDRKSLLVGQFHQPNTLTVSKDSLYWIEWGYNSVWKYPKNPEKDEEPQNIFSFVSKLPLPFGIVANYNIEDQTKDVPECEHLYNMAHNETAVNESFKTVSRKEGLYCLHGEVLYGKLACKCSPGYTGERCEISVCQNYCFEGDCSLTSEGSPVCSCKNGYTGFRCEINQCYGFCINDGVCRIDESTKSPKCSCSEDYKGSRCEVKVETNGNIVPREESVDCNCKNQSQSQDAASRSSDLQSISMDSCENWDPIRDPILMVLGIVCGLLCVVIAFLFTKIMHLRRRPRIKKRIIVNKNVTPLTARPDQCEITIENCCNMNICETPCFEPRSTIRPTLLDAKPGKEEKRNLIANMEHDDY